MIIDTRGMKPNYSDTQIQLKEKILLIKQRTNNRETVKEILEAIGIEITPQYKFKDNPSMSISNKAYIKDFSSSSSFNGGDVLDYMQFFLDINLPSAVDMVIDILNLSSDIGSYTLQVLNKPIKRDDKEPLKVQQQKIKNLEYKAKNFFGKNYLCFSGFAGTESLKLKNHKLYERKMIDTEYLPQLKYIS